jgi:glycosyltransferase involved in cell wall biosynthesis
VLVNLTVPVFNEEAQLRSSIAAICRLLSSRAWFDYELVIADNGSTDGTASIADSLATESPGIKALHLQRKGRGRALRESWTRSEAEICSYMDVDLSSDLNAYPQLLQLINGGADVAIGTRLHKESSVKRSLKREIVSRCYNRLIQWSCGTHFSDAQCGFKAVTRGVVERVIPFIEDNAWFFDSELLILCDWFGWRIAELPLRWDDDPDSRVKVAATALEDLRGLMRIRRSRREGRYCGLAASVSSCPGRPRTP